MLVRHHLRIVRETSGAVPRGGRRWASGRLPREMGEAIGPRLLCRAGSARRISIPVEKTAEAAQKTTADSARRGIVAASAGASGAPACRWRDRISPKPRWRLGERLHTQLSVPPLPAVGGGRVARTPSQQGSVPRRRAPDLHGGEDRLDRPTTLYQLQAVQYGVRRENPFQDGRVAHVPRSDEEGRLHREGGSRGRVPYGAARTAPQKVRAVRIRGAALPVVRADVRRARQSTCLHKVASTRDARSQEDGVSLHLLHGRLVHAGRLKAGGCVTSGARSAPDRRISRPQVEAEEVAFRAAAGDGGLGCSDQHRRHDLSVARAKKGSSSAASETPREGAGSRGASKSARPGEARGTDRGSTPVRPALPGRQGAIGKRAEKGAASQGLGRRIKAATMGSAGATALVRPRARSSDALIPAGREAGSDYRVRGGCRGVLQFRMGGLDSSRVPWRSVRLRNTRELFCGRSRTLNQRQGDLLPRFGPPSVVADDSIGGGTGVPPTLMVRQHDGRGASVQETRKLCISPAEDLRLGRVCPSPHFTAMRRMADPTFAWGANDESRFAQSFSFRHEGLAAQPRAFSEVGGAVGHADVRPFRGGAKRAGRRILGNAAGSRRGVRGCVREAVALLGAPLGFPSVRAHRSVRGADRGGRGGGHADNSGVAGALAASAGGNSGGRGGASDVPIPPPATKLPGERQPLPLQVAVDRVEYIAACGEISADVVGRMLAQKGGRGKQHSKEWSDFVQWVYVHEGPLDDSGCVRFSVILKYLQTFGEASFAAMRHAKSTVSVTVEMASGGEVTVGKSETFKAYMRGRSHTAVFKQKPTLPDPAIVLQTVARSGPLWALNDHELRLRAIRLAKLRTGMRGSDLMCTARERTHFRQAAGRGFVEFALLNPKEQKLSARMAGNFWTAPVRVSAVPCEEICLVATLREYFARTKGVKAQGVRVGDVDCRVTPWFFERRQHTTQSSQKPASRNVLDQASNTAMAECGFAVGRKNGGFTPHDWRAMGSSKVSIVAHGELDDQMVQLHRWHSISTFRSSYERPIDLIEGAVPPRRTFTDYQDALQFAYQRESPEGVPKDWLFEKTPTFWRDKPLRKGARTGTIAEWSSVTCTFEIEWSGGERAHHAFLDVLAWVSAHRSAQCS